MGAGQRWRVRVALGALTLLVVPLLVGGTTSPAAARSTLGLQVSRSSVIPGETVTFTGRAPTAGRRAVHLQQRRGGRWRVVEKDRTTRRGKFRVAHVPALAAGRSAKFRVRLPRAKVGRKRLPARTTRARRVRGLTQSGSLTLPDTAFVHRSFEVLGRFAPARSGRPVVLEARIDGEWQDVAHMRQRRDGTVAGWAGAVQPGTYTYRLTAEQHRGAPAWSTAPAGLVIQADQTVVAETTELLTTDEQAAIDSFDTETGELVFGADAPASAGQIAVGDVAIVAPREGLGSGALREVESVRFEDGRRVLGTRPAELPDVVVNTPADATGISMPMIGEPVVSGVADGVTIVESAPTSPVTAKAARAADQGVVSLDGAPVVVAVDVGVATGGDGAGAEAHLRGTVEVTPTIEADLDVDWGTVKSYRLGAGVKVRETLELSAAMTAQGEWQETLFEVRTLRGGPIGPSGYIWAELVGRVVATVRADGTVSASIKWQRQGETIVGVAGDQSDGLRPHAYQRLPSPSVSLARADAAGSLHGEVYGEVAMHVYSVAGPFLAMGYQADARLEGSPGGVSCQLSHGPSARVGLSSSTLLQVVAGELLPTLEHQFPLPQTTVAGCPQPEPVMTFNKETACDEGIQVTLDNTVGTVPYRLRVDATIVGYGSEQRSTEVATGTTGALSLDWSPLIPRPFDVRLAYEFYSPDDPPHEGGHFDLREASFTCT